MPRACALALTVTITVVLAATGCLGPDPLVRTASIPEGPFAYYSPASDTIPYIEPRTVADGPLTLAECIDIALQHNPRTAASWQSIRAAAAQAGQQYSRYFPSVNFTANGQRRKYQDLTPPQDEILQTTYEAKFNVTQLLLDGGARRANVNAAEAALRSTALRHNVTLLDVALEVERAYYNLLAAQSLLDVAEGTLRQRNSQLELAQRMQGAGLARPVEVLQAMTERDDARLGEVGARNQARITRGRLASAMGLSVSTDLEIVDVPEEVRVLQNKDVGALLDLATQNRPGLHAAVEQIASLREQSRAERAARWPTVEAQASYGWHDLYLLPEDKTEWSAAVLLDLPVFTGFQRTYRIRQVEAELSNAIATYEKLLRDVELEVWEAYSNVVQAEEAIVAAQKAVESANESLQAVEREYENGRVTIIELIDAQTAVTRALNREVTARLGWHLAVATLARGVGVTWAEGEFTALSGTESELEAGASANRVETPDAGESAGPVPPATEEEPQPGDTEAASPAGAEQAPQ